jgi:hypothetical protein
MAITKRIYALAALATVIALPSPLLAAAEPEITAVDAAEFMAAELGPTVTEAACHDFENADGWGRFLCFARVGDGSRVVKATMGAPEGELYLGQPFVAVIESQVPQLNLDSGAGGVDEIDTPTVEDAVSAFSAVDSADVMFPACHQGSSQTFTCFAVLFDTTTMDNRLVSGTVTFDRAATPPIRWDNVHTYFSDPSLQAPTQTATTRAAG